MKIFHQILIVILAIFLVILQISFLESLPILKYFRPLFILIVILTIKGNYWPAIIIALLGGIFEDLASVFPFGLSLISNLLVIVSLFYLKKVFDFTLFLGKIWLVISAFIIYKWFYFGAAYLFSLFGSSPSPSFGWLMINNFIIGLLLNTIVIILGNIKIKKPI